MTTNEQIAGRWTEWQSHMLRADSDINVGRYAASARASFDYATERKQDILALAARYAALDGFYGMDVRRDLQIPGTTREQMGRAAMIERAIISLVTGRIG